MKEENGGESRVANLHRTAWPNFREPPSPPRRVLGEDPASWAPPRPSWSGGCSAAENLAELSGRLAFPAGSTPDPSPRDYVHASLGFMDVERGAKEGLGGTSGFSEGVRFSPARVSEL